MGHQLRVNLLDLIQYFHGDRHAFLPYFNLHDWVFETLNALSLPADLRLLLICDLILVLPDILVQLLNPEALLVHQVLPLHEELALIELTAAHLVIISVFRRLQRVDAGSLHHLHEHFLFLKILIVEHHAALRALRGPDRLFGVRSQLALVLLREGAPFGGGGLLFYHFCAGFL